MDIKRARRIADLINNEKWQGFSAEAQEGLKFLIKHGNADDQRLAKFLLDIIT